MTFDLFTIIGGATAFLLTLLSVLATPFLRFSRGRSGMKEEEEGAGSAISIVLYAHDLARELERNLPAFLHQDYHGEYKVIVVVDKGDAETEDILKRNAAEPRLYTTYIPSTSRYMSRKKLAITVGVKAAKTDWVVVTEPTCRPADAHWLSGMARMCKPEKNLVTTFTQYAGASTFRHFYHMLMESQLLRLAHRHTAFSTDSPCVAFRKAEFISRNGFLGNLQFNCGEYDFLVNKYAAAEKTSIALDPAHPLIEEFPSDKSWKRKRLNDRAIRKSMLRRHACRALFRYDMFTLHLAFVVNLSLTTVSIITRHWLLAGATAVLLLSWAVAHSLSGKRVANTLNVPIGTFSMLPMLLSAGWYRLLLFIRFQATDKNKFTTHKL